MAQGTYPKATQEWFDSLLEAAASDMRTMGLEPGEVEERLRGILLTLDGRLLEAAERSGRDLEPTLEKALAAFTRHAKHRGIVTSQRALDLFSACL